MGVKLEFNNDQCEDTVQLLLDSEENKDIKKLTVKQAHKHSIRPEIQTLRAIAIFSVLLFHLWEKKFRFGFLGVDIFFVISGYLMCSILSKHKSLDFYIVLTFYERRFKRIVPLYLFVISIVLFSLFYVVSEIQFHQIVGEAISALFFTSNIPDSSQKDYFDESSRFYFFLHTWSLSVELQFYLLVPTIFLIFDLFKRIFKDYSGYITLFFILFGIVSSYLHQVSLFYDKNAQYMYLSGRIWQFFCGFVAQKIRDNWCNRNCENKSCSKLSKLLYLTVLTLLLVILFYDSRPYFLDGHQINSLFAIFLSTYIVAESSHLSFLMENKLLVILGDISYSVYLVHWPIITWYRYVNMDTSEEIDLTASLQLLFASIFVGFLVEKIFKFILKHINSWSLLLFVIFLGYFLNTFLLLRMERNALKLEESEGNENGQEHVDILQIPLKLGPNEELKLEGNQTREQMLQNYNSVLGSTIRKFSYCPDKRTSLPTNYKLNWKSYSRTNHCFERGNGNKTIVIVGNSHAVSNYVGIAHIFKDVYKTLIVDMHHSCVPAGFNFQQPARPEKEKKECVRFVADLIPTLRQWKEPIDIVIALFALADVPDFPIENDDIKNDQFFNEMQSFYQNLSQIPREALIIQEIGPQFKEKTYQVFMAKTKSGKDYLNIGESRKTIVSKTPNIFKRMSLLDCGQNCLKMNWIDFWCGKKEDGFCPGIDPKNGLLNFVDTNHQSPSGAIKQAKYMREKYENFMNNRTLSFEHENFVMNKTLNGEHDLY